MFEIRQDPLPDSKPCPFPFDAMAVGDCFYAPVKPSVVHNSHARWCKKVGRPLNRITTRAMPDGTTGCWRRDDRLD